MTRILNVYLHETMAGSLSQEGDGTLTFAYALEYLAAQDASAISISMPLREEPFADRTARPYFSGLLPDERARQRLASSLGLSEGNAFGLLEIIGGECAGALSLFPPDMPLAGSGDQPDEALSEQRLIELLDLLRIKPLLGGEEGVRLSLPGAQDKLAVCQVDGGLALPKEGRPTTHILKPFIEGLEGTVENELFCMKLAAKMGFDAPEVASAHAGETNFLLVERYDRIKNKSGKVIRLHQEDFCQALSVPPELKYEEEGGPGTAQCQNLIQDHTQRPAADRLTFQRMLIFHYLVGNADAHAKNYALLYTDSVPDLAPLYDVVCTAAYPRLSNKLAMQIDGRAIADTIQFSHWADLVPDTKAAQRLLRKDLHEFAADIGDKADELLGELEEQEVTHPILNKVRAIIETRSRLILRLLEKA